MQLAKNAIRRAIILLGLVYAVPIYMVVTFILNLKKRATKVSSLIQLWTLMLCRMAANSCCCPTCIAEASRNRGLCSCVGQTCPIAGIAWVQGQPAFFLCCSSSAFRQSPIFLCKRSWACHPQMMSVKVCPGLDQPCLQATAKAGGSMSLSGGAALQVMQESSTMLTID